MHAQTCRAANRFWKWQRGGWRTIEKKKKKMVRIMKNGKGGRDRRSGIEGVEFEGMGFWQRGKWKWL